jgi:hypothetical protein
MEYEIGDKAYLKQPELGYKCVEIIGLTEYKIEVRLESGYEFSVYPNELEED